MFPLLDKLLKPLNEKVDKLTSQIKTEQEARGKAMAEVEELRNKVSAIENRMRTLEEQLDELSKSLRDKGGQDRGDGGTEEKAAGPYWLELNRGSIFTGLLKTRTPKCAFEARGNGKRLNYVLCSLDRIRAYDDILSAVRIDRSACTLSEAVGFETREEGEIDWSEEDRLWHIVKPTLISLK